MSSMRTFDEALEAVAGVDGWMSPDQAQRLYNAAAGTFRDADSPAIAFGQTYSAVSHSERTCTPPGKARYSLSRCCCARYGSRS